MNATKLEKTLYWVSTGIVIFLMMWAVIGYHIFHENMAGFFIKFGYPTYLIYPLAYLKLAGVIVILTNSHNNLKEWVYGAYYINMLLATVAHHSVGDTPIHAYVGLIVVPVSYIYSNKVRGRPKKNLFDYWPEQQAAQAVE